MIYVISVLNVLIPILMFIISYKIDGKGTMGISIFIFAAIYYYLIDKEIHISVFYNSVPIRTSVIIGVLSFVAYNFWNMYLTSKMD